MPPIYRFECNNCEFAFPSGWGSCQYVIDDDGNRIICPHPSEYYQAVETIGVEKFNEIYKQDYERRYSKFIKSFKSLNHYHHLLQFFRLCGVWKLLLLKNYSGSFLKKGLVSIDISCVLTVLNNLYYVTRMKENARNAVPRIYSRLVNLSGNHALNVRRE